ncbi:MAG: hypothetical protein K8T91_07145, partial [Planctomycetes bacterium]|nr:hypothetical protein [Planctomycetota bacterium]
MPLLDRRRFQYSLKDAVQSASVKQCHAWRLLMAAVLIAILGATAQAAEPLSSMAVPRDGVSFPATLLRVEADGRIMLGVDGKPRTLAADQWIRWGSPAALAAGGPVVLAADGSVLPVDQQLEPLVLKGEKLSCDTRRLGRLELPLGSVRGVIFHGPLRSLEADLLTRQIVEAGGNSDQLILDNGDRLSGNLAELGADKLKLEVEGRSLELEVRNVVAIIFNPTLTRTAKPSGRRLMVGLSDGSRLHCTAAASTGTTLSMATVSGLELKTSLANVVWLQPLGRDVTYLSDLEAAGFRHTPYLSLSWPYHRDRNVQGGQLRSGGRAYLKGLGL